MPTDAASPIRLLHLSDIHVRVDRAWDSDPLLRALARTIAADVRAGLVPDLVVITGDLAHSGTAEEYDQAGDWLSRRLWPVLSPDPARPLPCERLLLVPGNHDCDRTLVGRPIRNTQQALLATPRDQFQEAVAECLGDPDECARLIKRHRAWLDFYGDWLNRPPGEARARPWWQRTLVLQGQRLHLAGLDSAWMACGDEDRGRLLLGRRQLGDTVLHRDAEGADWRLALMHHPWDSLAECDAQDARQTIHLACDLLLRGHLHQGEAAFIRPPDPARACLEVAAGSVYDGSHRPNSFHWIELWPATKTDPRRVRLLFRAWRKGAWQIDRNQPGCPDGTAEFRFDTAPAPETGPGTPPRPAVPPAYQAWLCQRYSGIDLLGQPVQQGQAVTLRQVYVPAVTTPERPSEPTPDRGEGPPPALLLQRLAATSLYCPGPAGAGKSTFCRWAVVQGLPGPVPAHPVAPPEGYAEPIPTGLRDRLPLLVPLREFWETMECGQGRRDWCREELTRTLANWIDQRLRPDGLDGAQLRAHLAFGSAFLLFDGLDEVPVTVERNGVTQYPRALLLAGLTDALPATRATPANANRSRCGWRPSPTGCTPAPDSIRNAVPPRPRPAMRNWSGCCAVSPTSNPPMRPAVSPPPSGARTCSPAPACCSRAPRPVPPSTT